MTSKMIPVETAIERWHQEPGYQQELEALEDEFAFARALIEARSEANLSQSEIAKRMQTSQPSVARLETGQSNPSLSTLRRYASATGTRLKISFEPISNPSP